MESIDPEIKYVNNRLCKKYKNDYEYIKVVEEQEEHCGEIANEISFEKLVLDNQFAIINALSELLLPDEEDDELLLKNAKYANSAYELLHIQRTVTAIYMTNEKSRKIRKSK